ncbi:MAG: hypothetical protein ACO3N7_06445 [Kiritimatiellia bacterium]
MKTLFPALLLLLTFPAFSQSLSGGRAQSQSATLEFYGGLGQMTSLEGRVQETRNGAQISGGLDTSLVDLNINDGSDVTMIGAKITGKWFTLLVDHRQSNVSASGEAEGEIRLKVDGISFAGQDLDYLLIPAGGAYSIESDTTWLGLGLRFTPFTINPEGRVRFTPWLHLGVQYIQSEYDVDAGSTVRLSAAGFGDRVYAVNGSATGKAELILPEYGLGGEVRVWLGEAEASPELVGFATWKILEYDGALDDLGVEDDSFDQLDLSYSSLELGANLYFPVGDRLDLLVGLYYEQVDSTTILTSKPSAGNFQREVELNYAITGLRAGLRF